MTRLLLIILLATSGLMRLPLAGVGAHGDCGHQECATGIVTAMGCCDTHSVEATFCPMSDGPCQCGVSPLPGPLPTPDAPLPKSDRDSLTAVPAPPIRIQTDVELQPRSTVAGTSPLSLLAGLTHNEIQALLGIWRM